MKDAVVAKDLVSKNTPDGRQVIETCRESHEKSVLQGELAQST